MGFLIALLTVVMVFNCLLLILLVLIQLPKKEAGAALAFGGGTTDALFGAGSGTVLTKITKYAATTFFVLAIVLSVMQIHYHGRTGSEFERNLEKPSTAPAPAAVPPATAPASTPATAPTSTNIPYTAAELTNAVAALSNAAATNLSAPG